MHRFRLAISVLSVSAFFAGTAGAGDPAPFSARSGLDAARDAALSWAADARLVYLENDEILSLDGKAVRWGYLFYSSQRGKARAYSVRGGKILEASDLGFDFEAPPLRDRWVDSAPALAAAEDEAGREFRRDHRGLLTAMLLIRGALHDEEPDATTWAVVYISETEPALVVVVDAASGKVIKTWRG